MQMIVLKIILQNYSAKLNLYLMIKNVIFALFNAKNELIWIYNTSDIF